MQALRRDAPVLRSDDTVATALEALLDNQLPALPVTTPDGRYCGVFGEREFIAAVFPAYLGTLKYAGFVPDTLDEAIERRSTCVSETIGKHLNSEHVELPPDASDASIAEIFLHHRVLIVPIVDDGRVVGLVRRWDFFRLFAEKVLGRED